MNMPRSYTCYHIVVGVCGVVVRAMVWTWQNVSPTTIIWNQMTWISENEFTFKLSVHMVARLGLPAFFPSDQQPSMVKSKNKNELESNHHLFAIIVDCCACRTRQSKKERFLDSVATVEFLLLQYYASFEGAFRFWFHRCSRYSALSRWNVSHRNRIGKLRFCLARHF